MKKILLATTALMGLAGAASAEIALSGYAEMGILGGDAIETQFHNDVVVNFNFSGETDGGLSFGGKVQLDDTNGSGIVSGANVFDDENFWISGSFGKLTLGEADGALDWAVTEIYKGTALADDHSTHAGAYGNGGLDVLYEEQLLRYEYAFGNIGFAVSAEMDDTGASDTVFGLGVKWSGDMNGTAVGVGLGYQSNGDLDVIAVSANATMANGFSVNLGVADGNLDQTPAEDTWMGLGLGYETGALMVQANYGEYDSGADGFGLVANYDLGGGATVMAGYGSGNALSGNGGGEDTFSVGLGLSF